ncbi:MAG: dihydroneopterin aldolase [Bacteroidia bacterium]
MGIIRVEGIRLYAFHGCLEEESRIGGEYTVDVTLDSDFKKAAISDELIDTVDYCAVFEVVKAEMAIRAKLIEHVCQRIVDRLRKNHPQTKSILVRVTKHVPPMNGPVQQVSVEIVG